MINLKTRLNNEIKHKMSLIKQVASLKNELKEAKDKLASQDQLQNKLMLTKVSPRPTRKIMFLQTIEESKNEADYSPFPINKEGDKYDDLPIIKITDSPTHL